MAAPKPTMSDQIQSMQSKAAAAAMKKLPKKAGSSLGKIQQAEKVFKAAKNTF